MAIKKKVVKKAKRITLDAVHTKKRKTQRYASLHLEIEIDELQAATSGLVKGGPEMALQTTAAFLTILRQVQLAREGNHESAAWLGEFWKDRGTPLPLPSVKNKDRTLVPVKRVVAMDTRR